MISQGLREQLGDWEILFPFFESNEWLKIKEALKPDINNLTPEIKVWFRAFKEAKYKDIKVVWLGLSPYYNKDKYTNDNIADGLAFSTPQIHSVPPSLFQLYKGLEWDQYEGMNLNMYRSNELTFLAKEGVLLLNSALTTTYGKPDSHLEIWKPFIEYVLKVLNDKEGVIFCGFGKVANTLLTCIDKEKHVVFEREHPAAAAYRNDYWKHEKLFTLVDQELVKQGKHSICWDEHLVEGIKNLPF